MGSLIPTAKLTNLFANATSLICFLNLGFLFEAAIGENRKNMVTFLKWYKDICGLKAVDMNTLVQRLWEELSYPSQKTGRRSAWLGENQGLYKDSSLSQTYGMIYGHIKWPCTESDYWFIKVSIFYSDWWLGLKQMSFTSPTTQSF